jgi:hypothetical protein
MVKKGLPPALKAYMAKKNSGKKPAAKKAPPKKK